MTQLALGSAPWPGTGRRSQVPEWRHALQAESRQKPKTSTSEGSEESSQLQTWPKVPTVEAKFGPLKPPHSKSFLTIS